MDFSTIKTAVAKQFERMKRHELFRTGVEKDALWETYLASFPIGTNPIYKERSEHDCQCCKQFVRAVGNVVAVIDGKLECVWDVAMDDPAYQFVANAMSSVVKSKSIADTFLHYENTAGTDKSFQQLIEGTKTWNHFFVNVPAKYVVKGADIASTLNGPRADHDVLLRSLNEITDEATATVLELVAQNSLYRGAEHKPMVAAFRKLQLQFKEAFDKDLFVWSAIKSNPGALSRIRNTAIGTLLTDLSEGKDLDVAVAAFESKVAPTNYKRPTSLITKAMIEQAKEKLAELGLTSALERRYATLQDITVNNILFANRDAKKAMSGNIFDDLSATAGASVKNYDKVEEVSMERFIADILPKADSIEVMFENRHASNLVSLIAPIDPTAGQIFKWPNNFSWSYNGEVTDSIKERVKAAGGSVVGDLCCRLAWNNTDDLDFHMKEPTGETIYYGCRRQLSPCGGMLDLDANGADGMRTDPAENIFYADKRRMKDGIYTLMVHQYNRRNSSNDGFEVEIDIQGTVHRIAYDKALKQTERITVATIQAKGGEISILESMPTSQSVRTTWALPTQTFHKVNVLMLSPNHWDDKVIGNKHYFFMLDGCKNDDSARGFFNEFLKEELNAHRKVFEVVGGKMKVPESAEQLSGLGFSSTQKNSLLCRVKGSFARVVKIIL